MTKTFVAIALLVLISGAFADWREDFNKDPDIQAASLNLCRAERSNLQTVQNELLEVIAKLEARIKELDPETEADGADE